MKYISLALALIAAFSSAHSLGEDFHLDPIKVTAEENQLKEFGDYQSFQRNSFHGRYTSLSEFLNQNASVQIRQYGLNNSADISIRGSSHKQVVFMIDNQVINNAQYGGFDLDSIPLNQIEKIEIIKGHFPGLDQQAIGGVVRLTRTTANQQYSELSAFIGQYNQQQVSFNQYLNFYGQLSIDGQLQRSENNYVSNITSPINNPNARNRLENLNNNRKTHEQGRIAWSSIPLKIGLLNFSLSANSVEKEIANYFSNNPANEAFYSQSNIRLQLENEYQFSQDWRFKTIVSQQENRDEYSDLGADVSINPENTKYNYSTTNIQQSWYYQLPTSQWTLSLKIEDQDYKDNELLLSDEFKCTTPLLACDLKSTRKLNNLYLQYQHKISKAIHFSTSFGQENAKYKAQEIQTGDSRPNDSMSYDQWGLNLNYQPFKGASFSLNLNKANRLPSLFELYGNLGTLKGNQNLEAEEANNISLDFRSNPSILKTNKGISGQLGLSLFKRNLENSIVATYNSEGFGNYENNQKADITGWETNITINAYQFSLALSARSLSSKTTSNNKSLNNKKLPGVYHQGYSVTLDYSLNRHGVNFQYLNNTGLFLDTPNLLQGSDKEVANFKYHYQTGKYFYQIGINNLFNKSYLDQSNHQAPSRNINFQMKYSF